MTKPRSPAFPGFGFLNLNVDFSKSWGILKAAAFVKYDEAALRHLGKNRDKIDDYILGVRREIELQEKLLQEDRLFADIRQDTAWDGTKRTE